MPVELGQAKIQQYVHTLIHYYDINPLIDEINKLRFHTKTLTDKICVNNQFRTESSNYMKILLLTKNRVENKLQEITPHPLRAKRGLVNVIGSIFKAIGGNLDAADGERYDKLIQKLETHQKHNEINIHNQNSLSLAIINRFNSTIEQVSHNEKLLETRIKEISTYINQSTFRENLINIKDTFNQLINLYEIIDSILQDIEHSLLFAQLNTLQPSVIKTTELHKELQKLEMTLKPQQLPFPISLENTVLMQKLMTINCYIKNNRITYLLHVPIVFPFVFKYYHLYSIPVPVGERIRTIIPKSKYILRNSKYFTLTSDSCSFIDTKIYFCKNLDIQEIREDSPCEAQIFNTDTRHKKNCQQTEVEITKTKFEQVDKSSKWIGIFPKPQVINFKCHQQNESPKLRGSYLLDIPVGCQISTEEEIISNEEQITRENSLILLPEFTFDLTTKPSTSLSIKLQDIKLDELHQIKNEILQNQYQLSNEKTSNPSIWTISLYIFAIIIVFVYLCFKLKHFISCWKTPTRPSQQGYDDVNLPVQLPL